MSEVNQKHNSVVLYQRFADYIPHPVNGLLYWIQ